ncbi:MAG: sulfatase-like hydrolase/transferase [Acidobacteria bacterium]|nr:sulfatase-like hydrolase/transferase [Acidobacteriota bacterium]
MLLRLALSLALLATLHAADKPNIVFIMVDDLGPEWVSSYGAEGIETPNIDKLVERGMKFENAYSMPQCTPTRATLLTGQYPFRHGWTNHWDVPRWGAGCHFDPNRNMTFARLIRDAGYATGIAGKWQINDFRIQPNVLFEHGFDEWLMWTGFEGDNPPSAERYWDAYVYSSADRRSRTATGQFGPDLYNDFVLDFVGRHKDEPMLVYYPMALTHGPLVATPHEPFAKTKLEMHRAMTRYTDYLVGRVMRRLEELGVWENTYLFFTTDNGTSGGIDNRMQGRTVRGGKAKLTENGPREPFVVTGPGVAAGSTTDALTDFSDLFPTFLELAGAQAPTDLVIDGRSIVPVIHGDDPAGPREWILAMGYGPARLDEQGVRPVQDFTDRVVRDKRYKIHVLDGKVAKLYDLREDPGEQRNLIGSAQPAHRAALAKLSAVVAGFPAKDARPRYDPLPPQPWDITPEEINRKVE